MARRHRLLWGMAVMAVAALMGTWTVLHVLSPRLRTSSSLNASRRLPQSHGGQGGSQANASQPYSSTVLSHSTFSSCPPAGFNPLRATKAQLTKYGFPPRPTPGDGLAVWTQTMKHARHCVKPQFVVRSVVSHGSAMGSQANAQSFTAAQAIAKVNNIGGTMFPATPGSRGGRIHEGPLPGGTIPGHLTTRVHAVGPNSYLVTFTEQWTSQAFPVSGHARIGHHQWTFKVTPHLAQVQSESGDYPPQATK
ncbi:MAG: hypothetical protein M0Z36_14550 [Thermaerobacter sp.]|nr:hypothetical protein [Thermaerobacter sp.]